MKKLICFFLLLFLFVGCGPLKTFPRKTDRKFCINECIVSMFKSFHSKGRSWGTSSSSMNGLSQSEIYKTVKKYCSDFYDECYVCEDYNDGCYGNTIIVHRSIESEGYYGFIKRQKEK